MSRFRNRKEAATYLEEKGLPISPKTLAKMATVGGGPRFQRFNRRPVYTEEFLDEWIAARLSQPVRSTSEFSPLAKSIQQENQAHKQDAAIPLSLPASPTLTVQKSSLQPPRSNFS